MEGTLRSGSSRDGAPRKEAFRNGARWGRRCSEKGVQRRGGAPGMGCAGEGNAPGRAAPFLKGCSRSRVRLSRSPGSRSRIDPAANLHSQIFGFAERGRLCSSRPGGRGARGDGGGGGCSAIDGGMFGELGTGCSTPDPPAAPTGPASPCGARSGAAPVPPEQGLSQGPLRGH